MFDVEEFYNAAHAGKAIDEKKLLEYIGSFACVVLWGAGNLGTAIGEKFVSSNIKITEYWDVNYIEKRECNGILVKRPFPEQADKDTTLVISCIVNGSLGDQWTWNEALSHGYSNYLNGMAIYEAIVCPLHEHNFDITECTGRKACSLCNCKKYTNLMNGNANKEGKLVFQLMTFIVSTRCTLDCKYCGQRLAEYAADARKDFLLEHIKRDMDNFLDAVDFIGMISVIGGEPFIHKDITKIVQYCLTKNNFGVINITTNGIVKLTHEMLTEIKNPRVKISFSIYDKFLNENQKALLQKNIKLVEQSGISYSVSHPLWTMPQELKAYGFEKEYMINRKVGCESIKMCAAVKDGKYYPCSTAENIAGVSQLEIGNSFVDVTQKRDLKEKIITCLQTPYYDVCGYCGNCKMQEIPAGEQV